MSQGLPERRGRGWCLHSGVVLEVPARLPDPHMRMFVFPLHLPPRTWLVFFLSRHPPNASLNNPASLNQKIPAKCLSSLFNLSPDLRTTTTARSPPSAANLCILLVALVGLDPRRVRAPEAPKGVRGRHFRGDGLLPEDPAGVSRGRAGAVPPAHARQGWDGRHAGRCDGGCALHGGSVLGHLWVFCLDGVHPGGQRDLRPRRRGHSIADLPPDPAPDVVVGCAWCRHCGSLSVFGLVRCALAPQRRGEEGVGFCTSCWQRPPVARGGA